MYSQADEICQKSWYGVALMSNDMCTVVIYKSLSLWKTLRKFALWCYSICVVKIMRPLIGMVRPLQGNTTPCGLPSVNGDLAEALNRTWVEHCKRRKYTNCSFSWIWCLSQQLFVRVVNRNKDVLPAYLAMKCRFRALSKKENYSRTSWENWKTSSCTGSSKKSF